MVIEKDSKQSLMPEAVTSDLSPSSAHALTSTSNATTNVTTINHRIFLVRHGDVDVPSGVCYGQLDCAVTSSFNKDVQKLIDYFQTHCLFSEHKQQLQHHKEQKIDLPIIITSPLIRCAQLAEGLQTYFDNSYSGTKDLTSKGSASKSSASKGATSKNAVQINQDFKEINFGQWEGQSWQSIGQKNIEEWNNDLLDFAFPDGESARSFDRRVISAWQTLQQQLAEQTQIQQVIIICHAGVIRSILSDFLQIPLQHSLTLQIDKMSVSSLNLVSNQTTLSRCTGVNRLL
ncbi:histidine phosphatase family protein [uncultured Psychromonas sp.]|uniref:histidine phosphatase family protein n=1 Tax=uncultured Psychromonas sp. TaxID=173974 RepID=UPI00260704EA|nr:histidine phosphatase family protein [uncultured Psychromonas sp.]